MVLYKHPKKKFDKSVGLVVKEWHRLPEVLGSRPTLKKVIFLNFFQLFTQGFRVRLRGLHFFWTSHSMILYIQDKLHLFLYKNAWWLRCSNTTVSTWFETQTQKHERPVRGQLQKGEVHENRREGGGPRTAETWFVSSHDDLRTEVWRGCTPKVPKL